MLQVLMLDGLTVLYKSNVDLYFYVLGGAHENELLLMSVLNCVYDSISQIMRKNVEKRALFENLDIIMLALDEICDGGIVLESDPQEVVNRVALRTDDIPLGEQTVAQVRNIQILHQCRALLSSNALIITDYQYEYISQYLGQGKDRNRNQCQNGRHFGRKSLSGSFEILPVCL